MAMSVEDLLAAEQLNARTLLRVASERLSTVRYVFVVTIEDGIPGVEERSALEYSDAVLIGWPEIDSPDVSDPASPRDVAQYVFELEKRIDVFRDAETKNDVATMADTLIHISEYVAQVRKAYQPDFLLPTYAEIRRYVQKQWEAEVLARDGEITSENSTGATADSPVNIETDSPADLTTDIAAQSHSDIAAGKKSRA